MSNACSLNQLHTQGVAAASADVGTPEGRAYSRNRQHASLFAAMDADRTLSCLAEIESLPSRSAHVFESLGFAFATVGRSIEAQSSVMFPGSAS